MLLPLQIMNLLDGGAQPVVPTQPYGSAPATYGIGGGGGLTYEQWFEETREDVYELVEEFTRDDLKNTKIGDFIVVSELGYQEAKKLKFKGKPVRTIPLDSIVALVKGSGYIDINTLRANDLVKRVYEKNKAVAIAGVGAGLLLTKLPLLDKYHGNLARGAVAVPIEAALKFLNKK